MSGRRFFLGVLLLAVWILFLGSFSILSVVPGIIFSIAGVKIFFGLYSSDLWYSAKGDSPEGREPILAGLRRISSVILFLPLFGWKVVRSGFYIASLALKPSIDFWPGIVKVKGNLPHLYAVTVLANLITLTPGTLSLDYDEENDDLYVHWIDVTDYGGEEFDKTITSGMRPWVRRFFT